MTKHAQVLINGKVQPHYMSNLTRQGEREVDHLEVMVPSNAEVRQGDEVQFRADIADLEHLKAYYSFDGTLEDQIGRKDLEWRGTAEFVDGRTRKAARISAPDRIGRDGTLFQFNGKFEVDFWIHVDRRPPRDTIQRRVMSLRIGRDDDDSQLAAAMPILYLSATDSLYLANINEPITGELLVGKWHHVRILVFTSGQNVRYVSYLDGVRSNSGDFYSTLLSGSTLVHLERFEIGYDAVSVMQFSISGLRFYDDHLSEAEGRRLATQPDNIHVSRFGGRIHTIEDEIQSKKLDVNSYGFAISNTKMNTTLYRTGTDGVVPTSKSIVTDLIGHTDLELVTEKIGDGITHEEFVADGSLYDVLSEILLENNWEMYTDYRGRVHVEPLGGTATDKVFEHGKGCVIDEMGHDDYGLVNQVYVYGGESEDDYALEDERVISWLEVNGTTAGITLPHATSPPYAVSGDGFSYSQGDRLMVRFPARDGVDEAGSEIKSFVLEVHKRMELVIGGNAVLYTGEAWFSDERRWNLSKTLVSTTDYTTTADNNARYVGTGPDRVYETYVNIPDVNPRARSGHREYRYNGQVYPDNSSFVRSQVRFVLRVKAKLPLQSKVAVVQDSVDSQAKYGIRSKRFDLAHINSKDDAETFASDFLHKYDTPRLRIKVGCIGVEPNLEVNDVVWCFNSTRDIRGYYVVKSQVWSYPSARLEVELGEYRFTDSDMHKEIAQRLHAHDQLAYHPGSTIRDVMFSTNFRWGVGTADMGADRDPEKVGFAYRISTTQVGRYSRGSLFNRGYIYATVREDDA